MKEVTAILPMKGNSERVPNKNLKIFSGKPLYHRVMISLLNSKYIKKIVVNTDSELIKKDIISSFGDKVIIHNRPKEIIGDFVSMNTIIQNDMSKVKSDYYIQTHSTNPLLTTASIDKGIETMFSISKENKYDSVFSVTKLQTRLYKEGAEALNHNPVELLRTQDLEPLYEENSNFYIFSKDSFYGAGNKRIGLKPVMYEIDKIEAIDIDDLQDFVIAETLYNLKNDSRQN